MMRRILIRKSGTFSLEEAARIRQAIESSGSAQCPACRIAMSSMVGENGAGDVWMLRCRACGRGLVLREDSTQPVAREREGTAMATH